MKNKKDHMLNVRLDKDSVEKLNDYSDQMNTTKSNIVKEALSLYFAKKESEESPFMLGKDLFGIGSSEQNDLSTSYKQKLKDKLREKHTH